VRQRPNEQFVIVKRVADALLEFRKVGLHPREV
jgi:hypothetical protein